MSNVKSILIRCKEILEKAEKAIESKNIQELISVKTSMENIYNICFPKGVPKHLSYEHFLRNLKETGVIFKYPNYYKIMLYLEKFKAFTEDLEKGFITNLSNIISLDLYSDLIEQAKELRKYNFESLNRAACVLARIILEDTLNKLCIKHGIKPSSNKASQMNIALKGDKVYSKAQFKLIEAWLGIGNAAAHPDPDFQSISGTDIDNMIIGIYEFSEKYLS